MRSDSVRLAILLGFCVLQADGFGIQPPLRSPAAATRVQQTAASFPRQQRVLKAGFGGDSSKKKKDVKIKPKQQWDRYTGDLKKEKPYRVAVKAEGRNSDEWLEVGNVKSKGGEYTKAAVARQRALIAEVRFIFFMGHHSTDTDSVSLEFTMSRLPPSIPSTPDVYFLFKYPRKIRLNGHSGMPKARIGS
jgi:hypothetical protein